MKKKLVFLSTLVICTMLILTGCLGAEGDKDYLGTVKEYDGFTKFEHAGFGFSYPENWADPQDTNTGYDSSVIILPNGTSSINVLKEELQYTYTMDQYVNAALTNIKEGFGFSEDEITISDSSYNGYTTKTLNYEYENLKFEQVIFVNDKEAHVLTYTARFEHFDEDYETILKIFDSFAIVK